VSNVFARLEIEGVRPLLWHRFGPDALPLQKRPRTGVAGHDPEEWQRTVLMTDNRQLYLEPAYIFGCFRDAGKHTSRKRGTLQPLIASTLQVPGDRILIDRWVPQNLEPKDTDPVYLDIRSVRNPSTRARNVRYRVAASPGWKASFVINWEITLISQGEMNAVARDAGQFVGLGDGRTIGLGRFTVTRFLMLEDSDGGETATPRTVGKNSRKNMGTRRQEVQPLPQRRKSR
jgi:hypothetical protein